LGLGLTAQSHSHVCLMLHTQTLMEIILVLWDVAHLRSCFCW